MVAGPGPDQSQSARAEESSSAGIVQSQLSDLGACHSSAQSAADDARIDRRPQAAARRLAGSVLGDARRARHQIGARTLSHTPRISVFPKCYFDALVSGEMSYRAWIADAATLGG